MITIKKCGILSLLLYAIFSLPVFADIKNDSEWQKINRVNQFFNQMRYVPDSLQWGQNDYWATPAEFLISNAGDCEDFAIAKYYTLISLGIDEEKMRLTHVTIKSTGQAHMVLLIQETGSNTFLTLDNRSDKIIPFELHDEFSPIYSFNADSLWITKSKKDTSWVGKSTQISLWSQLKYRMHQETISQ